jgi:hypothetical protein
MPRQWENLHRIYLSNDIIDIFAAETGRPYDLPFG